ncbi:glutathione peroxidase [Pulveribacter suum]|uniref:Glutathione peroxidase n=1 Tax=Pulveribacter suum TaxID=2116657 RepID=A0A2P1NPA3_9BURK|nr:glutathione peroxidase [Pulveribacter suum]AVP58882.1 glutathione peroxidase [Pulveribacter suum]
MSVRALALWCAAFSTVPAVAQTAASQPAAGASPATRAAQPAPANCPALLQHTFPRLQDESPQSLCQYAGKVLLVVNTASYCGFTYQYEGLEALYKKYKDRGLVVLGFPSNDFLQEKSDNKDIADFCYNTYGVAFPMFARTAVRGSDVNPLYRQLAQATGQKPSWNFNKYLIDRTGRSVTHYGSKVEPQDRAFVQQLEALLAQH